MAPADQAAAWTLTASAPPYLLESARFVRRFRAVDSIDDVHQVWSTFRVADPLHDDGVPLQSVGAWTSGPSGESIKVAQEKSKWCWAAAMQILLRHVGLPEKRQCEIAGTRLGKPCCVTPDDCNLPLRFEFLEMLLAENGVSSRWERAQLEGNKFWDELLERRPILLADIFDSDTDGHVRVAFGWQSLPRGTRLVRIADPAEAKISSMTFETLQRSR